MKIEKKKVNLSLKYLTGRQSPCIPFAKALTASVYDVLSKTSLTYLARKYTEKTVYNKDGYPVL